MRFKTSYISYIIAIIALAFSVPCHIMAKETFTVIIDPGHGGKDFGARGAKAAEKDIVLAVGKKLGDKIKDAFNDDEVKVIFTRDADFFVTLQRRAEIANKAKGHLFISIHANSVDKKNRNRKTIQGASVYTLGVNRTAQNLAVAKRENAVMVLENDYSTTYQGFDPNSEESYIIFEMEQNQHMEQSLGFAALAQKELVATAGRADKKVRQAGFWVLHATSMPAVLVELDFICNPTQEAFMASSKGQEKFAKALFNAFKAYKKAHDSSSSLAYASYTPDLSEAPDDEPLPDDSMTDEEPTEETEAVAAPDTDAITYHVQFATSSKPLDKKNKSIKNLSDVSYYRDGALYKYICGRFTSPDDAKRMLAKVKKNFPDAFIIRMKNGKRLK